MNGKGRSIDNIAIERFFRTLKYEDVYVKEYDNIKALKQGIECFIAFYNFNRLHSALNYDKPMNVYMPALRKEAWGVWKMIEEKIVLTNGSIIEPHPVGT